MDATAQASPRLILESETRKIIGCAMEVLNELGPGLLEKPYENALAVECNLKGIPFLQQARYEVVYKGVEVGLYIPDLVVYDQVIVDAKTIDRIGDVEMAQMINYLKISRNKVGLILNFKRPRLEWKKIVA